MTDAIVAEAVEHLSGLEELSLANCLNLTVSSLVSVSSHCQSLTLLDMGSCDGIILTEDDEISFPNLTTLSLANITTIDDATVMRLARATPLLADVNIANTSVCWHSVNTVQRSQNCSYGDVEKEKEEKKKKASQMHRSSPLPTTCRTSRS